MKELLVVMLLAQGADVSTSLMAFHRGAHELNPFVVSQKTVPFVVEGVGFSIAEVYLLKKIEKRHPKIAKVLAMIQIGGSSAASVNNVVVYRSQ